MIELETILRLTAFSLAENETAAGPPFPGGEIDFDEPFAFSWAGTTTIDYIASTHGRTTAPSDTPPSKTIPKGFSGKLNYGISLFSGVDPSTGRSSTSGELALTDTGRLDSLGAKSLDGATIELLRGDRTGPVSSFTVVARLATAGLTYTPTSKSLFLRDLSWLLDAPLHDTRFAGTGGYEGEEGLANIIRPIVFGWVENISPVQINAALLIGQVSCTPVQSIAMYDGRLALTPGADYATYALLAAATVAGGTFATCLALGLYRLGGAPAKRVTADVQGDNESIGGATFVETRAAIARRIAIGRGAQKFTTAQLDAASFTAFDTAHPAQCGWYWDQEITKAAALDEVMKGCLGACFVSILGLLTVWWLREPPSTCDLVITVPGAGLAGDGQVLGGPDMNAYGSPRQATYLGWARNYTPLNISELVGEVIGTPEEQIWKMETRKVSAVSSLNARSAPKTPIVTLATGYRLAAAAQPEADRQQLLLGRQRRVFTVKTSLDAYEPVIGKSVELRGYDRLGGSWPSWCIGVTPGDLGCLTLTLWG